ncbi:hypothetical protein [Flavobacterium cerinum]|uniref:YokE-like PH domain-containing protein n=1 Tax=Flavobacterium cerinum TaxID=2502784 RepID=A0ABY5IPP0_9FLAO|nr:hypothetical protein [Flavobacterium cerinum]UUC44724.1 hypothetical protein NOX80_13925 [Flavobacterium cerinum]
MTQKRRNDNVIKQLEELYVNFKDKILYQKKSVKSETFISGRRNTGYRFKKCDLIFLENGLVIIPFYNIGKYKIYINFFLINDNSVSGIGKLKRFNLNSFGNAVHIEFGESSVTSTNVEIRLKNLTQEEKNLINIRV